MIHIWPKSNLVSEQPEPKKGPRLLDPAYLVKWDENDPLNPQSWSIKYKCWVTVQLGMLAFVGSLGSSITTPADDTIAKYIGVTDEVAVLDVTLYL
jgi:hypothetical protein